MAVFSIIHFHVWGQVLWFWDQNMPFEPLNIFSIKNELRYYLLLPTLKLSKALGINHDWLFSIQVTLFIIAAAYTVSRNTTNLCGKGDKFFLLFNLNLSFFILLSLFMNGRLASAFFGIALIQLSLQSKFKNRIHIFLFFPSVLVGLWLCSVTSGVFLVANLILYFGIALYLLESYKESGMTREWIILAVLYIFILNYLLIILLLESHKTLSYFDYDFFQMLDHGAGRIFRKFKLPGVILLFIVMSSLGFIIHYLWNRFPKYRLHILPIAISIFIGPLGYSILLTGLPAALSLLNIVFLKLLDDIALKPQFGLPPPTPG